MAEKGSDTMFLLWAALSCMAMMTTAQADMVFYDGFTIEMPVWFEMIPRLRPPMLAPYKESAGHPNAVTAFADRHPYQPPRAPPQDYGIPGYSNTVHLQPKPFQYPRPQGTYYGPPRPPYRGYNLEYVPQTTTTSVVPPAANEERNIMDHDVADEFHEEESPESQ